MTQPRSRAGAGTPSKDAGPSLLLIGTGLVGGSFALAAKAAGLFDRVVGMDRDPAALREALALGIVDTVLEGAVAEALAEGAAGPPGRFDAACVAVPVGDVAACVRAAAPRAEVVFDVGSVKGAIVDALAPPPANYVPCHPVAGSERAGPAAARAGLFKDRVVALTPVPNTDAGAARTVRGYWERLGARVLEEAPAAHDRRLALLSHLPHLVAFAFMEVAGRGDTLTGAGAGFRDFTRIAAADAGVWGDILSSNAGNVRPYLDDLLETLRSFAASAEAGVGAGNGDLRRRIAAAARVRRALDAAEP